MGDEKWAVREQCPSSISVREFSSHHPAYWTLPFPRQGVGRYQTSLVSWQLTEIPVWQSVIDITVIIRTAVVLQPIQAEHHWRDSSHPSHKVYIKLSTNHVIACTSQSSPKSTFSFSWEKCIPSEVFNTKWHNHLNNNITICNVEQKRWKKVTNKLIKVNCK